MTKKIISLVLSALMLFALIPAAVFAADGEEAAPEYIIKTAEQIAADGNVDSYLTEIGEPNKVVNKGLVDGLVRFAPSDAGVGVASSAKDRAKIKIDDVVLSDYPYAVIAYKTNIEATKLNFNMVTREGTYSGTETKLFDDNQGRTLNELTVADYTYAGKFGTTAKVVGVYVPIYFNHGAVMTADDYFDIEYIGFFKSEAAYKAYAGIEDPTTEADTTVEETTTTEETTTVEEETTTEEATTTEEETTTEEVVVPTEIDCIIKTAEEIVADGTPELYDVNGKTGAAGKLTLADVKDPVLVDGMARFTIKDESVGNNAVASKTRVGIKIDDVVYADHPYAVVF